MSEISWEKETEGKFNELIDRVPVFLRDMAKDKVSKRAISNVAKDNRTQIVEKDLVDAFFKETPFGFHGPMKSDMEAVGINYVQYGYER